MFEADKRGGGRRQVEVVGEASDDSFVGLFELVGCVSRTPSREVATREAKSAILAALERLPTTYRTVIRRYDLDGAPIEVVAAEVGRSEGATYMLRSRAHRLLAELKFEEAIYVLPRVSDLTRGKIGKFSIDALVEMLARAGRRVEISTKAFRRVA